LDAGFAIKDLEANTNCDNYRDCESIDKPLAPWYFRPQHSPLIP